MDETKKLLRSLLVSSPMVLTVMQLNYDYKEATGNDIPFKQLGYKNLFDFLNKIPDVLRVNGNSLNSEVSLIVSDKTAHVNDMVLKQKKGKIGHAFHSNRRKKVGYTATRLKQKTDLVISPKIAEDSIASSHAETNSYNTHNCKTTKSVYHNYEYNKVKATNQNDLFQPGIEKNSYKKNSNGRMTQAYETTKEKNDMSRKLHYNDEYHHPIDSSKENTDLQICQSTTNNNTTKTDAHYLRRLNYREYDSGRTGQDLQKLSDMNTDENVLLESDKSDFMRQLLLQKYLSEDISKRSCTCQCNNSSTCIDQKAERKYGEGKNGWVPEIPRHIRNDLKRLIKDFPKGIWCGQLPDEYRRKFRKELRFEKLGYRNLINMCMDLPDIFYCNKESTCDFKLYDARKPKPKFEVSEESPAHIGNHLERLSLSAVDALPPLDWRMYSQLYPKDVVGYDTEIPRDFVTEREIHSDAFRVVVAEIYDLSKFWLFRDDGRLDALMDQMQPFYKVNAEHYRIPEQFLEIGLYCVTITLNEYHRCVIVKMQADASFVNVFYIDYGSLGTAPKDEVWFLTNDFASLPAQAIRARLANIYPPIEFSMWSTAARARFKELADMKHLNARITEVSRQKQIVEVCLENPILAPGRDVCSILVDEELALYANQVRSTNIHDPNCIPRVKFVHLFPNFEEIEHWLVPSIEEMGWFSNTDLTADFYLSQYFSRPIDKTLHDDIELKALRLNKKKEEPVEYIYESELKINVNIQDILKVSYGDLYETYENRLSKSMHVFRQYSKSIGESNNEWNEWKQSDSDCEDYQRIVSKLRSKFLGSNSPELATGLGVTNAIFTVDEEKTEHQCTCKKLDRSVDDGYRRPQISARKDNPRIENYRSQIDKWCDLSELERYLSQEDPSTSPSAEANLIDLKAFDFDIPNESPTNITSSCTNVNRLLSVSKGQRKARTCLLLSDSSSSDEMEPRTGRPRRNSSKKLSSSSCSDLIHLDVALDCPILTPEIVNNSPSKNENKSVSDADDEEEDEDSTAKLSKSRAVAQKVSPDIEDSVICTVNSEMHEDSNSVLPNAQAQSGSFGCDMTSVAAPGSALQPWYSTYQPWSLGTQTSMLLHPIVVINYSPFPTITSSVYNNRRYRRIEKRNMYNS